MPGAGAEARLSGALDGYRALVLGPGLSQAPGVGEFVVGAVGTAGGMDGVVIDADALNTLATIPDWQRLLPAAAILTPHPGEMARLTGLTADEVQSRRVTLASECAAAWKAVVVLKGANTVVAAPDGRVQLSACASAALATAGTGDVLAGAIGGLVAQGVPPFEAAAVAVYLHGAAGEMVASELGVAGVLAGDIAEAIPRVIRSFVAGASEPPAAPGGRSGTGF